jgi:beta-phosphoglucomutase-like phosphatase (HAD superfamily)
MQVPPPLTAVFFDLDDTLLDTAAVERRRWTRVAALVRCAAPTSHWTNCTPGTGR